ncbi:SH3 domain-containing protein [Devosia sp. XK-2]|uniref:SH3 domain-containing protein n=1 Tax=Devosia sp. XK-2 TaxID=3126689 RepID=UPI0030CCC501
MSSNRKLFGATLAAVTLLTTLAASAAPGVATGNVNVRTGPGTGYAKVGVLSTGEYVDVKQCQGSWCFVDRASNTDGWVAKSYLAPANPPSGGGSGGSSSDIPLNFGVTVGPGGPSFSFGIGDAPPPAPPAPPAPETPKVCFFKDKHFAGASFCATPGQQNPDIAGNWDNAIESIKVYGGAQVVICKQPNYVGLCATISTDKGSLSTYNNNVTSYQVF